MTLLLLLACTGTKPGAGHDGYDATATRGDDGDDTDPDGHPTRGGG